VAKSSLSVEAGRAPAQLAAMDLAKTDYGTLGQAVPRGEILPTVVRSSGLPHADSLKLGSIALSIQSRLAGALWLLDDM
jgi:hypothetical protein